jgi:hypothetical protein
VYEGDEPLPILLQLSRLDQGVGQLEAIVDQGDPSSLHQNVEYSFAFPGTNSLTHFRSKIRPPKANAICLDIPKTLVQSSFRSSFRVVPATDRRLVLLIVHPRLQGVILEKSVINIGSHGVAFSYAPNRDLLFPGDKMYAVIDLPYCHVRVQVVIRSLCRSEGAKDYICGLEIVSFKEDYMKEQWDQFVFEEAHPSLRLGHSDLGESFWGVLESSRYVEEATESLHSVLKNHFFFSWKKNAENPKLGRALVVIHEEKSVGTAAANLLYPGTWIAHHLGIDEQIRKTDRKNLFQLARKAYCGVFHMMNNMTDMDYFVVYADAKRGWNHMIYKQFMQRYSMKSDMLYDTCRLYKFVYAPTKDGAARRRRGFDSIEIVDSQQGYLDLLSNCLRLLCSDLEFDAFFYACSDFELRSFSQRCARYGYERERRVAFALDRGQPKAAMIVESGEVGVNIFGLLNKCWIVPLEPGSEVNREYEERLLEWALAYYKEKRKEEFIYMGPCSTEACGWLESMGFIYQADAFRFLAKKEILPVWMGYVDELMGMMCG